MKQFWVGGVALATLTAAGIAAAQDTSSWSWTGGYVGAHVGATLGTATFSDPFGQSIYGDVVRTPAFLGGGQLGYNWQVPLSRWVFGAEADVSGLVSDGTNTCLAYSGLFASANCRVRPNLTTTFTGRVGYAAGEAGRSLLYVKGGLAGVHETISATTNANLPLFATSTNVWKWGGTVGAGVEQALAPAWSLRFEYDWLGFGGSRVATPASPAFAPPPAFQFSAGPGASSVSQSLHMVKLGLNYRFGMAGGGGWPAAASSESTTPKASMPLGWEAEIGGRYWYSAGRYQKDLAMSTVASQNNGLASRLTYNNTVNSGEIFGRVESPWNIFAKGFIGAGGIASGTLNDEDWMIPFAITVPYSNTLSTLKGAIDYATIDVGYDFLRTPDHKLGLFAGYNYYSENKTAHGCKQFANVNSGCSSWFPNSVQVISENNNWSSLRVGVNGEIRLMDSLKLGADVAYLPYVQFTGMDNHLLRGILSPEWGTGQGVQLEAMLSYYVTPEFSIGVGGRYWAMWASNSYVNFGGGQVVNLPTKAERYGVFLQASYRFAQPPAVAASN